MHALAKAQRGALARAQTPLVPNQPGRGTSVITSGTTLRRRTVRLPPLPSPLQATRQGGASPLPPAPATAAGREGKHAPVKRLHHFRLECH